MTDDEAVAEAIQDDRAVGLGRPASHGLRAGAKLPRTYDTEDRERDDSGDPEDEGEAVETETDEARAGDDERDDDEAPVVQLPPPDAYSPSGWQSKGAHASKRRGRPPKNGVVQKKGRPPMAGSAPQPRKEPARDEIPRTEILAIQSQCPEVRLDIVRIGPNGSTRAGVKGIQLMPISALFDLQEPMLQYAGGGTFEFFALDPNTRQLVLPRWKETWEGRAVQPRQGYRLVWDNEAGKLRVGLDPALGVMEEGMPPGFPPPLAAYANPAAAFAPFGSSPLAGALSGQPPLGPQVPQVAYDRAGNMLPPPPDLVPGWMRLQQPPQVQWAHVIEEARRGSQAHLAVTQQQQGQAVALDWVQHNLREQGHLQADRARLEERTARLVADFDTKLEQQAAAFNAKLDAEREGRQRAERQLEAAQQEAKFAALRMELQRPTPPDPFSTMLPGLLSLAGAFVPVMVEGRRQQAALAQADRDSQTKILTTVLGKEPPNAMAQLAPLLAAATPFVTEFMKNNSPKMQAEVLALESDQRMVMLKMMADMMKESMPEAPPVWAPLVEAGIAWLGQTMAARQLAAGQQRQLLPVNAQQQMAPQNGQPTVVTPAPAPTPAGAFDAVLQQFAQQDADAANMTQLIFQRLPASTGFQTHEWLTIIFNIHAKLDVEQAADMIAAHLYHCQKFSLLPSAFTGVFEEGKTEACIRNVLQALPIFARDTDYCEAIIHRVTDLINEVEEEDDDEIEEDDDEEEQEAAGVVDAIITPAPGELGLAVIEQGDATASA